MHRVLFVCLLALLLVACGDAAPTQTPIVIVVTATPGTPEPTRMPTQSTSEQIFATASAVVAARRAPPTATAPLPKFGDTITFGGWIISLAKMEMEPTLETGKETLDGPFYLVWIDARNTQSSSDMLLTRFDWTLQGTISTVVLLQYPHDKADAFVKKTGRDVLNTEVKPQALTHPLLIFRGSPDLHLARLVVTDQQGSQARTAFDLSAWVPPTPIPPTATQVQPSPTPRPPPLGASSISITSFRGGYHPADFQAGEIVDYLSLTLTFSSQLRQKVTSFRGTLSLYDPFGMHLQDYTVTVTDPLAANGTLIWKGQLDYNQFINTDVQIRQYMTSGTLKYDWTLKQVIYDDGTLETVP